MEQISDQELMHAVKTGQSDRLSLLYERYHRRLFGFFFRISSDASYSEDLVQNVFERVFKYRHTYNLSGKFESWIFHIARNVHHDHHRKNHRYQPAEDFDVYERKMEMLRDEEHAEARRIKSEEVSNLHQAIGKLSEENRIILEMTKFQCMKYQEVGALMGMSESAVKVRIFRIMKELKELITQLEA